MKIALLGSNGFLGSYLYNILVSKGHEISKVSLRHQNLQDYKLITKYMEEHLEGIDCVINCAASKNVNNKNDLFLNACMPSVIYKVSKNLSNCKFVHISTYNVVLTELNDPYTVSKRLAEDSLLNTNSLILRPGLIWSWDPEGNTAQIYNLFKLPFTSIPFPYPGNLYRPIMVEDLAATITNLIDGLFKECKIISILGDQPLTLWDLANELAIRNNKRLIPISIPFLNSSLSEKKRYFFSKNIFMQQLMNIDRQHIRSHSDLILPFNLSHR